MTLYGYKNPSIESWGVPVHIQWVGSNKKRLNLMGIYVPQNKTNLSENPDHVGLCGEFRINPMHFSCAIGLETISLHQDWHLGGLLFAVNTLKALIFVAAVGLGRATSDQ